MGDVLKLNRCNSTQGGSGRSHKTSVCVIGLGYIGLPTAAVLADHGYQVHGVDVRRDVIDTVNRGEIHIHEPGLGDVVNSVVKSGRLVASLTPTEADVFIICVPTPIDSNKAPDLSYVKAAAAAIKPFVRSGNLVILESTSPPETTQNVVAAHAIPESLQVGEHVFVAYCPERVIPGRILIEVTENDRIVGGISEACTERVASFYRNFVTGAILKTNAVTAELTKLTENAYRDVNIAFANELSMLADGLGADPFDVIELANRHPRVNILQPGPGVGGHCISVDPWFLVHAKPLGSQLIRNAREVNDKKPHFVLEQIKQVAADRDTCVIGCLGLAYKGDVDDLRESPSLEIVRQLRSDTEFEVLVCEPYVSSNQFDEFALTSLPDVLQRSDVLVLLTNHSDFIEIPYEALKDKHLIDTQGVWREKLRLGENERRDVADVTPFAA